MKTEATEKQELDEINEKMGPELVPMVMSVPEAGKKLGLGISASYAAAKRKDIPTIRIGRKLLVPVRRFRRKFE